MNSSRRGFFKQLSMWVAAGLVLPSIFGTKASAAEERRRPRPGADGAGGAAAAGGADGPLATPGQGIAASLNYVHDKKTIKDAKVKTERQSVAWDKQNCSNCLMYTKLGNKGGEEVGKCQLISDGNVKAQGWCNSWAKKG